MVNVAVLSRTQQKVQTGQPLTSRESLVAQMEQKNIQRTTAQGYARDSSTYTQQQDIQAQPTQATLQEYKQKYPDYIVEQKNGEVILKAPLKRIDPNYGDKYSPHVLKFNAQGQLTREETYITQKYQGSYHQYLINEKDINTAEGTTREKQYQIQGYGTELTKENLLDYSGRLISQDTWGKKQQATTEQKYYYNPITKSYSTEKIEGQEGVSKEQATNLTKTYINQGLSPIQVKYGPQTIKGGGFETVSSREYEKLYSQGQIQTKPSQAQATSTYQEPSRRIGAKAPTTGLKAEGLETGKVVNQEKSIAWTDKQIEKFQNKINSATKKAFSLTPVTKKSYEAYEKSYGEGHGTFKEQVISIPAAGASMVVGLPSFGYRAGKAFTQSWAGMKPQYLGKFVASEAKGMATSFEKAPVSTVGGALLISYGTKKAAQVKDYGKPISSKTSKAIKEFDIGGEYPDITQTQHIVPKQIKATEYREQIQKFGEKEITTKEKATDYSIRSFEPTAFIQASKKGEKISFFSVEVGGKTYQTISKPPFTMITEIGPTGKTKARIIETKYKGVINPFKKIEAEDILLGKFKSKTKPFIKSTETIKRFDVKNVEKEGVPLDKYYKFEEQYTGEELLTRKLKKRPRVLKDTTQRLTAPVPKEITRQKQLTIFETKYVKVGKQVTPVTGVFLESLESDLVSKTQKPAATVALGKPVVYPEIGARVPEFVFKKVEPTEYEFVPFKVFKQPSKKIGLPTGETYITKESLSRSSQRYKYKGKGFLSFKEPPLQKKVKVPTPVVRETKPFEWLKEEPKPEVKISPLGDLSKLEAEQRLYGIKRRQGQDIMEQFAEARQQRQQIQEIEIMQPRLPKPEQYFGYPLEDLKGVLKTETRLTPLSSTALSLQNKQISRQLSKQFQAQRQVSKQSQLQNQLQKQLNIQTQIQKQRSIQQQQQRQTQVQTQAQKSIQQQRQVQRQTQIQLTPSITLQKERLTPEQTIVQLGKLKPQTQQGYNVFIKRTQLKTGVGKGKKYYSKGFEKANKEPLTKEQALALGGQVVDKYANRSFTLRKADKPAKSSVEVGNWENIKDRFRLQKRNSNVYVEKEKFAINSMEEIEKIPYQGQKTLKELARKRRFF